MKEFNLKVKRTIRFLFYRNLNISEQLTISKYIEDDSLLNLFWKMSKADRKHSYDVFERTKKVKDDNELLILSLFHDIGKSTIDAGLFFRIFSDIGVINNNKSFIYLNHEIVGLKVLEENNINNNIVSYYKNNLLKQKDQILDKTDY